MIGKNACKICPCVARSADDTGFGGPLKRQVARVGQHRASAGTRWFVELYTKAMRQQRPPSKQRGPLPEGALLGGAAFAPLGGQVKTSDL